MSKNELFSKLQLLLAPGLVILLGLILVFDPDSASVLIAKLLGWVLVAAGICTGVGAILSRKDQVGKGIAAVALVLLGGWLGRNPLFLAAWVGRIIGLMLVLNGVQDILTLKAQGSRFVMPLIVTVIGAVLILMPMTTSRLVFTLCGIVVLCIGAAMLLDRLKTRRQLQEPEDPNIIDAL